MREHIGDGVYIEPDEFGVVLTTHDGIRETNRIYMEPEVIRAFQRYIAERNTPGSSKP